MTFTPFDPLPASDLNDMVENIEALADGSAFNAQAIPGYKVKINPPQGMMTNGQISRTVSSNNLTVALKTLAGADPSASDPVYIRIGNSMRAITAALGVTKNAGTNWMDLGSASHATQDVDVFVYLGYNATDGVVIGFSRIPYARVYSDFSTTNTNDRYAAISTIANASANNEYEVIGRVNVTLSATASFNWSVPATSIIINRPIFETRWLSFVPATTNVTVGNGTITAKYLIRNKDIICEFFFTFGSTSSLGTGPAFALPITAAAKYITGAAGHNQSGRGFAVDAGLAIYDIIGNLVTSNTAITLYVPNVAGTYPVAGTLTAAVPSALGNGDGIQMKYNYEGL